MFNWISPLKLRDNGILGMNERNISFINRYNDRKYYPIVDDKLQTKIAAKHAKIAVPHLISTIDQQGQVTGIDKILGDLEGFVIKPARGSGGKGILVITGKNSDGYHRPNGTTVSMSEIHTHVTNILAGLYSLGGAADVAMIEALVNFDPVFDRYSFEGVPDIRVIVFRGFPVMAMLRCSTSESDGKANLHQGAVGVGINLLNGHAIKAVQHNAPVTHHPDTGHAFEDLIVPHWDTLMHLATSCYEMTRLGYLGCDIVLDQKLGPLILEVNARPGLAIQVANNAGLRPRLQKIESLYHDDFLLQNWPIDERVQMAKEFFGKEV